MAVDSAIVVGAGVAGLTAALSLAEAGTRVKVLEQSAQMSEVGAGLQISPNGARVLDRLGVLPSSHPTGCSRNASPWPRAQRLPI